MPTATAAKVTHSVSRSQAVLLLALSARTHQTRSAVPLDVSRPDGKIVEAKLSPVRSQDRQNASIKAMAGDSTRNVDPTCVPKFLNEINSEKF